MISTLSKNGAGYAFTAERSFDAWGNIRLGSQSGDPKGRYCASLSHKQDDESGLTYMRARYYEPNSGRFVSEDPGSHGVNWFVYCSNDPVNRVDQTGKGEFWDAIGLAMMAALAAFAVTLGMTQKPAAALKAAAVTLVAVFTSAMAGDSLSNAIQGTALEAFGGMIGFGINGLAGVAATVIIDLLTGDTDNPVGDMILGFIAGGVGGVCGGADGVNEMLEAFMGGIGMGALQGMGSSASKNP